MDTLELARKLAKYKQVEDAQKAYNIALKEGNLTPDEELEAASYIFASQGDYRIAYTSFVSLFNRGFFQAELLDLMSQAFYFPNLQTLKNCYEENCRLLKKYPYFFREDFLPFEELPIWFFPFDDHSYIPYYPQEQKFGSHIDFSDPVIDRYFFHDLDNPILAQDVYSQYQLEYLNDTVRKSEWVGRENHIYLHYTDWPTFCAYLQCLTFHKLLQDKKFVFLIESEIEQYPIDFKARFGIDYSQYPVKPVGVREINRLIWHTQLATHNGGDFFNEIFYGHPNLLALDSVMMDNIQKVIQNIKKDWKTDRTSLQQNGFYSLLISIKKPTDKDFMVALFLSDHRCNDAYDHNSRIAPALLFQPHFPNIEYEINGSEKSRACILYSKQYETIRNSPLFRQFKYIKTFVPMRRITTSYAASTRFAYKGTFKKSDDNKYQVIEDVLTTRILNRSFMADPSDRLYRDSVLVRFEDGKLNPKATFSALAEFLDLPYTKSMTYCSTLNGGINVASEEGNVAGFDPATVYRTYDDYADDADRAFLEYFMRDAYEYYGYDFHYYHGEPVDHAWIEEKACGATHLDSLIEDSYRRAYKSTAQDQMIEQGIDPELPENLEKVEEQVSVEVALKIQAIHKNRIYVGETMQTGLHFVNREGQPLHFIKKLELNPDLLEQPLYH